MLGFDKEIASLREGIRAGVIHSPDDPGIAKRTVSVPLAEAGRDDSISHDCLLIVSIPGASTPAHFERATGCLAAIRRACGWYAGEAWVDREVFGAKVFRSDWKDHWFQALSRARRGLLFMSSEAHSPHLEWEFDRMNDTFRSEDVTYVLLDADSDDPVFHYTRAFAQAQGSTVFSLSATTPEEIGRYFASLDWSARITGSAAVRFAPRTLTPHTNSEVQDISCIGPRTPLVFTVDGLIDSNFCDQLIHHGESLGFTRAVICYHRSVGHVESAKKQHLRVFANCEDLADELFRRLAPYLPPALEDSSRVVGFNPRLRWLRYNHGHYVQVHQDGSYTAENGDRSLLTVLVYLNEDFEGGCTRFYGSWTAADQDEGVNVLPRKGRVCVMQHDVLHSGAVVTRASKYCLRAEVLYERAARYSLAQES